MANSFSVSELDLKKFAVYFIGAWLAIWIAFTVRTWYQFKQIPGPFMTGFSKLWLFRAHASGRMHEIFYETVEKHDGFARIAPNILLSNDPDLFRKAHAARSPYTRSIWYRAFRFDPRRENLVSQIDDKIHNALRARMTPGYSGRETEGLEEKIDNNVHAFLNLIRDKYVSDESKYQPMDFAEKISFFTLDIISGLKPPESPTDTDRFNYIKTIHEQAVPMQAIATFPSLVKVLQSPIFRSLMPSAKDTLGLGKLIGIAETVVGERFGENKKVGKDMLGSFIAHGLTREEAESEVLLQVLAGSDTSATTMRMTTLNILSNPRILNRLREEIAAALLPKDSIISDSEARKLPYLQAVIKEGIRYWPPVAGLLLKTVPAQGDVINGMSIPGGTDIGFSSIGVQRNKGFWGSDADVFRPERWLEVSPERLQAMTGTMGLVFAYGKWQCLGEPVAKMELNKIFVELFRAFDFSLVDAMNPVKSACGGIFVQTDMWLRVEERSTKL
ncbi:hypothetical protein BP6252_03606 [Coleophoma cylindrospora]|uniref:Uncharacterized protein n=1 Tax=Coleophoma cylindrospora TaxID=1849047 RepID=A0A3D8S8R4_9HELO|nr:hypothetical protein BP6252_03606 [Coleophoma cylindrospora]